MNHSHNHTHNEAHHNETTSTQPQKGWKAFVPLVIIFLVIIATTAVGAWVSEDPSYTDAMRWFMGTFFIIFGLFKVINIKNFAIAYSSYDIVAKRVFAYGYVYPFIELALGIAYWMSFSLTITNAITVVVMGISAIGVAQELLKKNRIPCACLRMVFILPMTTVTLIEDLLMGVMATGMLILS